jgi:nitrogen fixation-related uncharacterized protein
MVMAMIMIMIVIVVVMIVIRLGGFRIALHERFDDPAQRVLIKGEMAGKQAGEPRKDQWLAGQARVTLVCAGFLAVPHATAERVGEELVHVRDGIIGRGGLRVTVRLQERAGMREESCIELPFQFARIFVDIAAHGRSTFLPDLLPVECPKNLGPRPEERALARVSKDRHESVPRSILRDASLRDAPQDEACGVQ